MKILTFPYLGKLQHYSKRNPSWLKSYAALLGPHAVRPHDSAEVVAYVKLVWELSDHAKLLLSYLELKASNHDPMNQLPYNLGWIAHELGILQFSQRPRMLQGLLDELLAVGLAESLEIESLRTARHSPLARASAPLDSSELLTFTREGSGEGRSAGDGLEDELPADLQGVSVELRIAAEHYGLAASKAGWPAVRNRDLRALQPLFDRVTDELRESIPSEEQAFDWLLCFGQAAEQPFIADIPGVGFAWFLRNESEPPRRLNALKVWDYAFVSRKKRADQPCGQCAGCIDGLGCTALQRRRGSGSGYVIRWRDVGERVSETVVLQRAFAFASCEVRA